MKKNLQKLIQLALLLLAFQMPTIKVWAQSNPTTTGPIGTQLAYGSNEDIKYWNGTIWVAIPSGLPGQNLKFINGVPTWVNNPNGITTNIVSNVTGNTANCGGHIASSSGSSITARGVCWSTLHNPTIANIHTSDDVGKGNFTSNLIGLTPNATIYFRAYATNSAGTVYGNEVSANTPATLPSLNTTTTSLLTGTNTVSGGTIISNGGLPIISCGICWDTLTNPTILKNKTSDSLVAGSFISSITALSPVTTYYVRAYAINSIGISYGNQISFTTLAILPTIITVNASSITTLSAICGGNITNNGGASITSRGICWNILHNPTIFNNKIIDSTINGNFFNNIIGLTSSTTYYVRAYATNSVGTSYGSEVSFTTQTIDIDGNVYDAITIGTQIWMKQNLNVTHYRNGDSIPNVTDNTAWTNTLTGAYCNCLNDSINSITYGRLYNWYTVVDSRNLCPTGWHVPSNTEWNVLVEDYLGGNGIAGGKLKEAGVLHWQSPNTSATNETGFTALPGGYRYSIGGSLGNHGYWWSSTESSLTFAINRIMSYSSSNATNNYYNKFIGCSVRCLKD